MSSTSRHPGHALALAFAVAVAASVAARATNAADPASPSLNFVLSANGLPNDGLWKGTPVIADVNGDGHLDIAAHRRVGKGPSVWLGNGKGEWKESRQGLNFLEGGSCGGGLEVADVNGDNSPDLVVADHCEGAFVFLGDGKGNWQAVASRLNSASASRPEWKDEEQNPFNGAEELAVGDVNEDGFPDLVVVGSDRGGFAVYLGDGSGKNWKEVTDEDGLPSAQDPGPAVQDEGGWAHEVLLLDVNGDKHLDLVASYFLGPWVWRGDGKARWQGLHQGLPKPPVGGLFHRIATGDVNGDGRLDMAVANHVNGIEVFLQKADSSWERAGDPMPDLRGGAQSVALGDLDGDGLLDMVAGGSLSTGIGASYGVFALKGDGKAGWVRMATPLPEFGQELTWGLAIGDVNADKRPDLVVTLGGAGAKPAKDREAAAKAQKFPHVQVWLNQGRPNDGSQAGTTTRPR